MSRIPDPLLNLNKITNDQRDVTFATREYQTREPNKYPTPIYAVVTKSTMFVFRDGQVKAFHGGNGASLTRALYMRNALLRKPLLSYFGLKTNTIDLSKADQKTLCLADMGE